MNLDKRENGMESDKKIQREQMVASTSELMGVLASFNVKDYFQPQNIPTYTDTGTTPAR